MHLCANTQLLLIAYRSAAKLSQMEAACLAPLFTTPARGRRILLLRNEMLRRQRSKIDQGGLTGPWFLSREEATAGLGIDSAAGGLVQDASASSSSASSTGVWAGIGAEGGGGGDDASAVYQVLTLLALVNPAHDILKPLSSLSATATPMTALAAMDDTTAALAAASNGQADAVMGQYDWGRHGGKGGKKVVVVGGGFAGVTAARRLRGWGYEVLNMFVKIDLWRECVCI